MKVRPAGAGADHRYSSFCPACHQRRTRQTGAWIAASVCHDAPHRQFVFTFPKMLRGIFRKRPPPPPPL